MAEDDGCRAVSLRLTSPSGPGTPESRILAVFVRRAVADDPLRILGRGTRKQNYLDVRDVALAVEACLTKHASGIYNIAAANTISNCELAKLCIDELGSSAGIEFVGEPDPEEGVEWDVSASKAYRDLGYRPRFTIRDSIQAIAQESQHSSQRKT
jgi:nucleoside-diphosphate-sugar epimerase